ncbi:hypothetical protein Plhal304r1_c054g0139041 [Plasmopara halstedii]
MDLRSCKTLLLSTSWSDQEVAEVHGFSGLNTLLMVLYQAVRKHQQAMSSLEAISSNL